MSITMVDDSAELEESLLSLSSSSTDNPVPSQPSHSTRNDCYSRWALEPLSSDEC